MINTLFSLALALLIAAQGPNVPIELKNQAIQVAHIAIQYAQQNATSTEAITPAVTPNPATITVTPITDQPVFGGISTPTQINIQIPQTSGIVSGMKPIDFTGWDGSKVSLTGGADASTTITLAINGAVATGTPIKIYDIPYNHLIVDTVTDDKGQYQFLVGQFFRGGFSMKFQAPAVNVDKVVPFLVEK